MGLFTAAVGEQPVQKLTPDEFAELVRREKPHLLAIEDQVKSMKEGYGEITIDLEVRAFKVVGIKFHTKDKWILTSKDK